MTAVRLELPSELRFLPLIRKSIEEVCLLTGLSDQARHEMVLAVNEACANIICHAHRGRPELPFTITCLLRPEGVEVCLRDQGEPLDFDAIPELDPTEMRRGGRGVFLIRRLVDRITCEHPPEGGNLLRLSKGLIPD